MSIKQNLIGQKFGRLLVISEGEYIKNTRVKWNCQCDCGKLKTVVAKYLKDGTTRSCGCAKEELFIEKSQKMILARTKYHPMIASARYVWRDNYKDMSFDDFLNLSQKKCFYCNSLPNNCHRLNNYDNRSSSSIKNGIFIYNGLDRINSSKPHSLKNCVPCCIICNRSKRERSINSFINYLLQFTSHVKEDISIYRDKHKNIKCDFENFPFYSSIKKKFTEYNDGDLPLEIFYQLTQLNCYYCGSPPSNKKNNNYTKSKKIIRDFIHNGLDRIDNTIGHNYTNVVPCCKYCNYGKNKLNLEEFYKWIEKINSRKDQLESLRENNYLISLD